jgi:hypothetical protein
MIISDPAAKSSTIHRKAQNQKDPVNNFGRMHHISTTYNLYQKCEFNLICIERFIIMSKGALWSLAFPSKSRCSAANRQVNCGTWDWSTSAGKHVSLTVKTACHNYRLSVRGFVPNMVKKNWGRHHVLELFICSKSSKKFLHCKCFQTFLILEKFVGPFSFPSRSLFWIFL